MDKSIILLWSVAIFCALNFTIAAFFSKKYVYSIISPATLACATILFLFFYHPDGSPMGMIYLLVFAVIYILISILRHKKSVSETLEKPILKHKIQIHLVIWLISSLISVFLIFKSLR